MSPPSFPVITAHEVAGGDKNTRAGGGHEGIIRPTATQILHGINAANLRRAHEMLESGDMIGKLVVEGWDN